MPNVNGIPIKLQHGTKAQLDSITLQLAEPAYVTDTKELYVGDGVNSILVGRVILNTFVNRPAAGVQGRLFVATDTNDTYVDNGSNWIKIGTMSISGLSGNLDDIDDGTTYVRILATETSNGTVIQLNDGTNVVTAAEARAHIDNTFIHAELDDTSHATNKVLSANQVDVRISAAFNGLDYQNSVIDFYDPIPSLPTNPSIKDRYIASETANGWTKNNIYEWDGTQWVETVPNLGFRLTVESNDTEYAYNSSNEWVPVTSSAYHNSLSGLEGGGSGHYYHLDATQYAEATQYATDLVNGLMTANDHTKLPTSNQKDALVGTSGAPSSSNKYVTDSDPRMSDARTPLHHASTHQHGGSDEIATSTPTANAIPKANVQGNLNAWITEIDGGTFV